MNDITTNQYIDIALRVLARSFVKQISPTQYSKEWSRAPLNELLPLLFELLNYHPGQIGDIIEIAYRKNFSDFQKQGIIRQLETEHKELFGSSEQRSNDENTIRSHTDYSGGSARPSDRIPVRVLHELANEIINIFAKLSPNQESEHRTLEALLEDIYPLFTLNIETAEIGFDLIEFSDFWRKTPVDERQALKDEITGAWPRI